MSFQITEAFVDQYKANIMLLSQQKVSRLWETCRVDDQVGDTRYVERIGATEAQDITTRHGDTPLISTPHSRRKLTVIDSNWADLIDSLDKVKMLIAPESTYVQNASAAFNRKKDSRVLAALGGPAYSGHEGGTTVQNYAAGECRIIEGDGEVQTAGSDGADTTETALTIAKLGTCKELLDEAEVDGDRQRYFVTSPANIVQLLQTTEVKSIDYNTVKALAQGQIDTFMGFKFIQLATTRFTTHSVDAACKQMYAYAQGAIVVGVGQDIKVRITERDDKNYSTQVYVEMSTGATRVEGPAVVEILLPTTGKAA